MASTRFGHLLLALAVLLASACSTDASFGEDLWVADNYVFCNEFDEPERQCMLVSHSEFDLYRHIEGDIEGFTYEEGTAYHLRVERTNASSSDAEPTYRLLEIVSAEEE